MKRDGYIKNQKERYGYWHVHKKFVGPIFANPCKHGIVVSGTCSCGVCR